jgi:hypothetical protein
VAASVPSGAIINEVPISAKGGDSINKTASGGNGGTVTFKDPQKFDFGDPVRTVVTNSGAIDISGSEVFGWLEIDIPRAQAGKGSGATRTTFVDSAIRAVQSDPRYAAKGFHSQIAVLCQNWSKDGAPPGADWRNKEWSEFWIDGSADGDGKVTLTPPHNGSITAHEMGHGFAMEHDVSADFSTHYADPCCIMSQRNSFTHPAWQVNFGPAVCLPHLVQRHWMYNRRVFRDNGAWLSQPGGITMTLAQTSDPGARAHLGVILSYTKAQTNWDYYLEYARPDGWNRGLTNDFLFIRRIGPGKDIGPTPAILGSIAVPPPATRRTEATNSSISRTRSFSR